jgi:hypothetical protein
MIMNKEIILEINRINGLMGTSNKLVLKEASSPNPTAYLEKIFEIFGLKAETMSDDIQKLEEKIAKGTATVEETNFYKSLEDNVPNKQVTPDNVAKILENPTAYGEKFESFVTKEAETNEVFRQKLIKSFESVNPSITKLYDAYKLNISPRTVNSTKTEKVIKGWRDALAQNTTLPDFIKTSLNSQIDNVEKTALAQIKENAIKWKTDAANLVTESMTNIKKYESALEVLKNTDQKIELRETLTKIRQLVEGFDLEDDDTYKKLIQIRNEYQKLNPNVFTWLRKKFGDIFEWASCSINPKTGKRSTICIIIWGLVVGGIASKFPSLVSGVKSGIQGLSNIVGGIISALASDEPTPENQTPTPTPTNEPKPGTLEHFKTQFPNGIQGKDNTHFKSSNESDIQYTWNDTQKKYAVDEPVN